MSFSNELLRNAVPSVSQTTYEHVRGLYCGNGMHPFDAGFTQNWAEIFCRCCGGAAAAAELEEEAMASVDPTPMMQPRGGSLASSHMLNECEKSRLGLPPTVGNEATMRAARISEEDGCSSVAEAAELTAELSPTLHAEEGGQMEAVTAPELVLPNSLPSSPAQQPAEVEEARKPLYAEESRKSLLGSTASTPEPSSLASSPDFEERTARAGSALMPAAEEHVPAPSPAKSMLLPAGAVS